MSGKPCTHAIFLFGKVRQLKVEDYMDDYYSVERFKVAYQFEITPMGDKSQWPKNDPGFEVVPPPLERPVGRQGSKESRLVESQKKEVHINAKGASNLDI